MKCKACGLEMVPGKIWDGKFIAGECDLRMAFEGHEDWTKAWFGEKIPKKPQQNAEICPKCLQITILQ